MATIICHKIVRLERMSDYKGVKLQMFHSNMITIIIVQYNNPKRIL